MLRRKVYLDVVLSISESISSGQIQSHVPSKFQTGKSDKDLGGVVSVFVFVRISEPLPPIQMYSAKYSELDGSLLYRSVIAQSKVGACAIGLFSAKGKEKK